MDWRIHLVIPHFFKAFFFRLSWCCVHSLAVRSHFGSSRDPSPGLSFRCMCHRGNPIKTLSSQVFCLLCTSHGPCCLSPYHRLWEIWLYWILSALCGGIWVFQLGSQRLDDEKAALLAAKNQFLPSQCRIEKQNNYLERVSKRMEILQKWMEADQELEAANSKHILAKHEMAVLVAEQTAENAKKCQSRKSRVSESHVRIHL